MVIDAFGRDPLKEDFAVGRQYWPHVVAATEQFNPQAIALKYYNDINKFPYLLQYNGLVHQCEVEVGMRLMIPLPELSTSSVSTEYTV